MTARRLFGTLVLSAACAATYAHSPADYHQHLTTTLAQYSQSVEDCESLRTTRQAPDAEVLQQLQQFDPAQVRVFLVYSDYKRMQNCASDAAAPLFIAIGSLKQEDELLNETHQAIKALEETLFLRTDIDYELKYRQLPADTREQLERMNYFMSLFSAFSVIDRL